MAWNSVWAIRATTEQTGGISVEPKAISEVSELPYPVYERGGNELCTELCTALRRWTSTFILASLCSMCLCSMCRYPYACLPRVSFLICSSTPVSPHVSATILVHLGVDPATVLAPSPACPRWSCQRVHATACFLPL